MFAEFVDLQIQNTCARCNQMTKPFLVQKIGRRLCATFVRTRKKSWNSLQISFQSIVANEELLGIFFLTSDKKFASLKRTFFELDFSFIATIIEIFGFFGSTILALEYNKVANMHAVLPQLS
jgi:hypothetical protein